MKIKLFLYIALSLFFATLFLSSSGSLGPAQAAAQGFHQTLPRGWVGVILGETDSQPGVHVSTVLRRSPAYEGGMESGDRILSVNGRTVRTAGKLQEILSSQPVGRQVKIEVDRHGANLEFELRLTAAPPSSEVHRVHFQGYEAPDLLLHTMEGEAISLPRYEDRPLVLTFWATWCTVCRQVSRKLEDHLRDHPDSFDVLEITAEDAPTVERHLQTRPKALTIAIDSGSEAHSSFLVNSYPLVVVLDAQGIVLDVSSTLPGLDRILENLTPERTQDSEAP